MDNRISADQHLSAALHSLHRLIVGKGAAIDELHANNQELGAVLDGLVSTHSDLRAALETDGFHGYIYNPPNADLEELNLADLEQQAELIAKKSQAVVQESMRLRMRAKTVRAALSAAVNHDKSPRQEYDQLSKREREVLALIVAGKSSKEIAAELGISFKTAVTHRASIMSKMEVHEIASVVREAIRRGLA
jgi:DNA-binding NarL/FixJ family response regulator